MSAEHAGIRYRWMHCNACEPLVTQGIACECACQLCDKAQAANRMHWELEEVVRSWMRLVRVHGCK